MTGYEDKTRHLHKKTKKQKLKRPKKPYIPAPVELDSIVQVDGHTNLGISAPEDPESHNSGKASQGKAIKMKDTTTMGSTEFRQLEKMQLISKKDTKDEARNVRDTTTMGSTEFREFENMQLKSKRGAKEEAKHQRDTTTMGSTEFREFEKLQLKSKMDSREETKQHDTTTMGSTEIRELEKIQLVNAEHKTQKEPPEGTGLEFIQDKHRKSSSTSFPPDTTTDLSEHQSYEKPLLEPKTSSRREYKEPHKIKKQISKPSDPLRASEKDMVIDAIKDALATRTEDSSE